MAIDRTSKVAFAELEPQATKLAAADFLRRVLAKLPYQMHTVLTNKASNLATCATNSGLHLFDRICTEHRLTQLGHPWTNG